MGLPESLGWCWEGKREGAALTKTSALTPGEWRVGQSRVTCEKPRDACGAKWGARGGGLAEGLILMLFPCWV